MKEDPARVAIIGTGAWSVAIGHVMKKSRKIELATCYDVVPEKRREFSEKFECGQEESYEDVLKRDDVDGVYIISPNHLHAEQAVLAAEHGKHVMVEKPLANTIADGKAMVDACKKANVTLMCGFHLRRITGFRKMKELIAAGAIGDPIQIEGNMSQNLGFTLTPESFRWRGDDTGCPAGGLMTMGIHFVDLFNHFLGPVDSVFSYFNKLYIEAPVEDVGATVCRFESGVLGYLGSNYASPRACYIYAYGTEANLRCSITLQELPFEQYLLRWQLIDNDTRMEIFEKGKTGSRDLSLEIGNPVLEEVDEFADCIKTGKRPETDGEGALIALAYIRAAIESAGTGQQVTIKEILGG